MNYALIADATASNKFRSLQELSGISDSTKEQLTKAIIAYNNSNEHYDRLMQEISKKYSDGDLPMLCRAPFVLNSKSSVIEGTINCPWITFDEKPSDEVLEQLKQIELPLQLFDLTTHDLIWNTIK